MKVYLDISILTSSSKPLNIKWTELKKIAHQIWFTQIIIKPFEQTIHYENTLMTFCTFPKRSLKKYKPGHPEYFLRFREMLIQHFVFASPVKEHHCVTVNTIHHSLYQTNTQGIKEQTWFPTRMCSSRKYPYFPHRRDWNFLGGGGFCKAKKFKEMYEAYSNWNFQRGGGEGLRKNPFRGGGMDIFWNYAINF